MNTEEAFEILHKYFTKEDLEDERRRNKLDNSETDTIKERMVWSKLLEKKATVITDEEERKKILNAADYFKNLHNQEFWNK